MIASADAQATAAGVAVMARGGNAADAAIATSAAMAVVAPHLCGMGGDLFALVHDGNGVHCLDAAGRAGSGASAEALRVAGHERVPMIGHIAAVTVPGCVAGWMRLHERFGSLALGEVFAPAIALARDGFAVSPLLIHSLRALPESVRDNFAELGAQVPSGTMRRPGVARTLEGIVSSGKRAFYEGEFGAGLIALGDGLYSPDDLGSADATWIEPLSIEVFGHRMWSVPAPSQGYLFLAALALAEEIGVPDDPDDPRWAHLVVECATAVGHDRPAVLHDRADLAALLPELCSRGALVNRDRSSGRTAPAHDGDTTYLCTVDAAGMGVSLINSNAAGFGSGFVEPSTGINLQNRGLGFSLVPGHPAELAPGRKPPHTLCPSIVSRTDGTLAAVLGSMGGDAQPQIVTQVALRLMRQGAHPHDAVNAGRVVLRGASGGFDTWTSTTPPVVQVEGHAPDAWAEGLESRGHRVERRPARDSGFGHAHAIVVERDGARLGGYDERTIVGACSSFD